MLYDDTRFRFSWTGHVDPFGNAGGLEEIANNTEAVERWRRDMPPDTDMVFVVSPACPIQTELFRWQSASHCAQHTCDCCDSCDRCDS